MQAEEYIKKLYLEHPKPLYLSKLGGILKQNNFMIGNLLEFVGSMKGFTVAYGPEKERTAIAAVEDKEKVEALLNKSAKKLDNEAFQFLSKLPRILLFAFSSRNKANPNIYITDSPPYWFGFTKENESMIEIRNDLLLDAKIPVNLKQLDPEIANKLHENIKKWLSENDLDFSVLVKDRQKSYAGDQSTLLEKMIDAIPANKRSKVVLPLDIIEYLIKKS